LDCTTYPAGAGIANWTSYYGQNLIDQWMIPFFAPVFMTRPMFMRLSAGIRETIVFIGVSVIDLRAPVMARRLRK